jgi:hypothetical protein
MSNYYAIIRSSKCDALVWNSRAPHLVFLLPATGPVTGRGSANCSPMNEIYVNIELFFFTHLNKKVEIQDFSVFLP